MKETEPKRIKEPKDLDRGKFLGDLMLWCFRWGCEVQLRNKAWNTPVLDPASPWTRGEHHEIDQEGTLVDMLHRTKHRVIQIPELIFTRDGRSVSFVGHSWEDLMNNFKYSYRKIYLELSVPIFGEDK